MRNQWILLENTPHLFVLKQALAYNLVLYETTSALVPQSFQSYTKSPNDFFLVATLVFWYAS
jgi:hypothetical protein